MSFWWTLALGALIGSFVGSAVTAFMWSPLGAIGVFGLGVLAGFATRAFRMAE